MRTPLAVAAAVLLLLVAGCGGSSSTRTALRTYIDKVDSLELTMRPQLVAVDRANRRFSTSPASLPAERPTLVRSHRTLAKLTARLRALAPPPQARRLHTLLVALAANETSLAGELVHVASFLPPYRAALQPLPAANVQLQHDLSGRWSAADEAAALERYALPLQRALDRLAELRPPALLAPAYRTQVATLAALRRTSLALAAGLRRRDAKRLPALTAAFSAAARGGSSLTAQRAQIAAVRAFDARGAALAGLAARIERERARLDRSF